MITATILGQIFGITFLITAISVLINHRNMLNLLEKITNDIALSQIYGYITVLTGATLLAFSNFSSPIAVMITILGILSLFKGIFFLWFPRRAGNFNLRLIRSRTISIKIAGISLLLISILLLVASF